MATIETSMDIDQLLQPLWGTMLVWKDERNMNALRQAVSEVGRRIKGLNDEYKFIARGILREIPHLPPEKAAPLTKYFRECAPQFVEGGYQPRTRLLAGEFLFGQEQLPEMLEGELLELARSHAESKDNMTHILARRAICRFSNDWEEVDGILKQVSISGSAKQYVTLAYESMRHLPAQAICEMIQHVLRISENNEVQSHILAQFYARSVRRITETLIDLVHELRKKYLDEDAMEFTPIMSDYQTMIDRVCKEMECIPDTEKERALIALHLAGYAHCMENDELEMAFIAEGMRCAQLLSPEEGDPILQQLKRILDSMEGDDL